MADRLSSISEAMKQASEAYAESISILSKAARDFAAKTAGNDANFMLENWLRLARMGKDGMVTAIEQGFEMWERELRRLAAPSASAPAAPTNPMETWAENWRNAATAFTGGGAANDEFRKQVEAMGNNLTAGIRAWQKLWEPEKK
jgi:hypothetical protein